MEEPNSLVPKGAPPELCSVCLGDAEVVALEEAIGEDGLQLCQHVAEDQGQLCQVPPDKERGTRVSVRATEWKVQDWGCI